MDDSSLQGTRARHGSSGATLNFIGSTVQKVGDKRVGEQGAWLNRYGRDHMFLPDVWGVGENSYWMPRFHPAIHSMSTFAIARDTYLRLSPLWAEPAEVELDLDAHGYKVGKLVAKYRPTLAVDMAVARRKADLRSQRTGLTHGDPTFDNMMVSGIMHHLILIDPLPATPAVPDMPCVDIGKIMQSAIGYEAIRYPHPSEEFLPPVDPNVFKLICADESEFRASLYWCAVHLLRAMPYMPTDRIRGQLHAKIRLVLSRV